MHTPWGRADSQTQVADGIVWFGTPSHGGFLIRDRRRAEMPEPFASFVPFAGVGWYEEDCDWCIVALAFPEHFQDPRSLGFLQDAEAFAEAAERTLRNWHPDLWEAWQGRELQPGESYKRDN